MTTTEQIEKQITRIADAIVELVERTDGFVLLAQLDPNISGFNVASDFGRPLAYLVTW
jgi:hypothetical protein